MPTPVAHLLTGYAIHRVSTRSDPPRSRRAEGFCVGWILLCAAGPDLDHLYSWLLTGDRLAMHREASHGILAVALAGMLGAAVLGHMWSPWKAGLASAAALASHIALDMVTGAQLGMSTAYGAALLSPVVETKFQLPFSLLPGLEGVFTLRNAGVALVELGIFGLLAITACRLFPRLERQG